MTRTFRSPNHGAMSPVHMTCLTCGDSIRLSGMDTGRSKYQVWTHSTLRMHMHNALPAPSLIADLIDLAVTERIEKS